MMTTLALTLAAAFFEALGAGMIIPILQSIQGQEINSIFISYANKLLQHFSLQYTFVNLMLVFLGLMMVKYLFVGFQKYTTKIFSATLKMDLRNKTFESLMRQPLSHYYSNKIGDLHATVFNSADFAGGASEILLIMASSTLLTVTYLALNSMISFKLTLLALGLFGITLLLIMPRFKKSNELGEQEKTLKGVTSSQIIDSLGGIKTIKAYHNESLARDRFFYTTKGYRKIAIKMELNSIFCFLLYEPVTLVAVVILMTTAVQSFHMNILIVVTFFYIFNLLAPHVRALNSYAIQLMEYLPHFSRTYELIHWNSDDLVPTGNREILGFHSRIEIKNLYFKYPNSPRDTLKNINLIIPKNTTVALVGMSGGGKTTLVDIISRHHNIQRGQILVDGVDLMDIRVDCWHQMIAVVDQSPYIFNDSICENIRFGFKEASDEAVVQAAKSAYAHDFIIQMSKGYQTVVGNQGIELSGGQKQRIALARALVRNPDILILDEATSQLDSDSEQKIQRAIEKLEEAKTIIVIAHRLSTIVRSQHIFLIENGEIIEEGEHQTLHQKGGRYRTYFDLQFATTLP